MIAIESQRAEGFRHGGLVLVPVSRTVTVRFPGRAGGLVWNRPLAVEVRRAGGQRRFLPVHDPTRRLQWLLLAAGAAAGILLRIVGRRRRRRFRGRKT